MKKVLFMVLLLLFILTTNAQARPAFWLLLHHDEKMKQFYDVDQAFIAEQIEKNDFRHSDVFGAFLKCIYYKPVYYKNSKLSFKIEHWLVGVKNGRFTITSRSFYNEKGNLIETVDIFQNYEANSLDNSIEHILFYKLVLNYKKTYSDD